jgi:hypothetical protein
MPGPPRHNHPATCVCGMWEYDEYGSRCPSCPPIRELTKEQLLEDVGSCWAKAEILAQKILTCGEGHVGCWHDNVPARVCVALDTAERDVRSLMRQLKHAMRLIEEEM